MHVAENLKLGLIFFFTCYTVVFRKKIYIENIYIMPHHRLMIEI
jgi:hypothetical protein